MARPARRLTALVATVLALAACAAPSAGGRESAVPAVDLLGEWELVDGSAEDSSVPVPPGARATIAFADGQAGGTSFCNSYRGAYTLSGSALRLDDLYVTEMACVDEDVMAAETAYWRALDAVDAAAVEDGELLLTGEGAELRFRQVTEAPPTELVGTRWVLETLVEQDMASSTVGEPAVLVLAADGALSGSTGCRTLTGRWARNGTTLVFPEVRATGDCPADVGTQDETVLAVLDGERSAEVDGDLLTITGRDQPQLIYRAAA